MQTSLRKQNFYSTLGTLASRADFRSSGLGNLKTFEPWKELQGWIDAYAPTLPSVSAQSGQKLSTVYTCLNVLRETHGSLPCDVKQSTPSGRKTVYGHPVHYLVHDRPNPYMTAFTFWGLMQLWKRAWGNAYAYIQRDSEFNPVALWPKPPWEVDVMQRDGEIYYRCKGTDYRYDQVLHFKNYTTDGIVGISSIRQNALTVGMGLKLKDYNSSLIGKRPYGYLTSAARPKDTQQKERMKGQWDADNPELDSNPATETRLHKPGQISGIPLLYGGLEFHPLTLPADDVQYIDSAKLNDREIYGIFRMLPTFAQDWEKAPYNSSEQQDIHFAKYTLADLRDDEQECNDKLFPESNKRKADGLYVKFNVSGLLRGDIASRMNLYRTLINLSVMQPAHAAELEDLPVEEVMKRYYVQGAMVPADKVDEFIASKASKGQAPAPAQDPDEQRRLIMEELRELLRTRLNGHYNQVADLLEP